MPETPAPILIELIGFIAGASTTAAFVPQALKTWRTRSAEDLSLLMYLVFTLGVTCWLIYGIGVGSRPVIAANAVTLMLVLSVLAMKIVFTGKARRSQRHVE